MKELKELTDKLKKTADEIRGKVDSLNERFDESPPLKTDPSLIILDDSHNSDGIGVPGRVGDKEPPPD